MQFESALKFNRTPKKQWGVLLITQLRGRAKALLTIEAFESKPSYIDVKEKLQENFGPEFSPSAWMNELGRAAREPGESLLSLSLRIKELTMKAYPDVSSHVRSRMAIPHFVKALNDESQQDHILAALPDTFEKAAEVALACENGKRAIRGGGVPQKNTKSAVKVNHLCADDLGEPSQNDKAEQAVLALTAEFGKLQSQVTKQLGEVGKSRQGGEEDVESQVDRAKTEPLTPALCAAIRTTLPKTAQTRARRRAKTTRNQNVRVLSAEREDIGPRTAHTQKNSGGQWKRKGIPPRAEGQTMQPPARNLNKPPTRAPATLLGDRG
jgi:hypothetical protein